MQSRAKPPARWGKLLADPDAGWPWPYADVEMAAIHAALSNAPHVKNALRAVVSEARRFLSPRAVTARSTHIKPNPRTQLQDLSRAVQHVKAVLENLDYDAERHLLAFVVVPDQDPNKLLEAVFGFESNYGLVELPEVRMMGRKPNSHINAFVLRLYRIFDRAYAGQRRPVRGFPAFLDACLDPVDPAPVADRKSRQDQLLSAKRREKSHKTD